MQTRARARTARQPGMTRRELMRSASATVATAALMSAVKAAFPAGVFAQGAGPEIKKAILGYIALIDASALVDRQGEGLLRQARHARRRGRQAGLLGRHARQRRAGLREQRHRRRAHPLADALSDLDRQGHAEQRADADVPAGPAQPRCPGHLGLQRIQGPQGHHRRLPAQGRLREEEGRGQGGEGRHDIPRRHARPMDSLLAGRGRHRPGQGHLHHRRAAAADGGEHEGRQHGRVLRRRAVERAARQPEHRLHGLHDGRDLVQASRRKRSACAPSGSTSIRTPRKPC